MMFASSQVFTILSCLSCSLLGRARYALKATLVLYDVYYGREGRFLGSYLYCSFPLDNEVSGTCALYGGFYTG